MSAQLLAKVKAHAAYILGCDESKLRVIRDATGYEKQPHAIFRISADSDADKRLEVYELIKAHVKRTPDQYTDHHGYNYSWDFGPKRKQRITLSQRYEDDCVEVMFMQFNY